MNEYDSERIYDFVKKINYIKTNKLDEADCYVLNTCHIREKATTKVYHEIGRVKKNFKNKKKPIVIVSGCVAQAEGDILLSREKYINAVIGPQSYQKINETILKLENKENFEMANSTEFSVIDKFDNLNNIKNSSNKISSFLTIQEGCDKFCKFCVVPYTRGAEYSRSANEIFNEANQLVNNGVKEITLLGQNVNAYNHNGTKLSDLIYKLSKIVNLHRIRYTTSHPIDFSEDLISAHKNVAKLMPLVHLPVQSGSDKVLRSMNRKHTVDYYLDLINKLKRANPLLKFSSDFIIGYPGETEEDFQSTLKLIDEVKFINIFSFVYSARPGTPAAKLKETEENIAKERLKIFQKKAEQIKMKYKKNLFRKSSNVLFENKMKDETNFFGRDEYLNSVIVSSKENLQGKIKKVDILDGNHNTLFGKIRNFKKTGSFAA